MPLIHKYTETHTLVGARWNKKDQLGNGSCVCPVCVPWWMELSVDGLRLLQRLSGLLVESEIRCRIGTLLLLLLSIMN